MSEPHLQFLILVLLIFLIAGCVKGTVGMGLPTVSIALLGLLAAPAEAAALLVIPSLITNLWQFVSGPDRLSLMRRMWPMLLSICIATWAASGLIARGGARHAEVALGGVLIVYGIIGLAKIKISLSRSTELWLSPIIGILTGIVTGSTGVLVIPAGPYLHAIGLEKDNLVQALGLSFMTSTVALAAGLASRGAFHVAEAGLSTFCIVPALIGMSFGKWIRVRIDPSTFRRLFFIALLLLGGELILRSTP